ncbi:MULTISPECIES: hypothetical protein [unclassified Sphingobacterium]|uniref:hypothetical protein n=1 Tax=unclassified Sphingobacterium TaxID=2609468 RepID=UPI0025E0E01B|nr:MULTISPECIES: hypothetical protein [unclassified Sphingobacterium]
MKTNIILILCILGLFAVSCKKDPVIDGGIHQAKVNMTTYDFLKSHSRNMFDTTILIIDKAGLKDLVNSRGTFFVPNDYSIAGFLALKQAEVRKKDERLNYTLDTLFKYFTPQMLKDSIGMYFIPERQVNWADLAQTWSEYQTSVSNLTLWANLESLDGYNGSGIFSEKPKVVYLNKVVGEKDLLVNGRYEDPTKDPKKLDLRSVCQTSGIETTTGIVHVLANTHIWTFKTIN